MKKAFAPTLALFLAALTAPCVMPAQDKLSGNVRHVLLISIDGMHELDFLNCSNGLGTVNGGDPYCPNLAYLAESGAHYTQALAPFPSDSFPGLIALVTGGTPRSTGVYYDVSYDRNLSPPAATTPGGIPGGTGLCPGTRGTQVGFDETIDFDLSKLDGAGGINPAFLPRDPDNFCAPVYPHSFLRVNTMFEVVRAAGGYTAWADKHPSYDFVNGPSGAGVSDLYTPEINSAPVALPQVMGCSPLPDQGTVTASNAWTDSFQNIQCYDKLKVQSILNEINGKFHDGSSSTAVPVIFGMNFQAVSIGQKLHEKSLSLTGGYLDSVGTPSAPLLGEIQFVDESIGAMIDALAMAGLSDSTMIVVTAKHGQSPIDPNRVTRIPHDVATGKAPSDILGGVGTGLVGGGLVGQALEDDVSLIWLTDAAQTASSVKTLEANEALFGGGEVFSGAGLQLLIGNFNSRTPDIVVTPNVGVTYTGGSKKIAEHGGRALDDRNVMLLVSSSQIPPMTITSAVETRQVAPTILKALGFNPNALQAARREGTQPLPLLPY